MNTSIHCAPGSPTPDTLQVLASLRAAVSHALEQKRRLGQYAVLWQDGRPVVVGDDAPAPGAEGFGCGLYGLVYIGGAAEADMATDGGSGRICDAQRFGSHGIDPCAIDVKLQIFPHVMCSSMSFKLRLEAGSASGLRRRKAGRDYIRRPQQKTTRFGCNGARAWEQTGKEKG